MQQQGGQHPVLFVRTDIVDILYELGSLYSWDLMGTAGLDAKVGGEGGGSSLNYILDESDESDESDDENLVYPAFEKDMNDWVSGVFRPAWSKLSFPRDPTRRLRVGSWTPRPVLGWVPP